MPIRPNSAPPPVTLPAGGPLPPRPDSPTYRELSSRSQWEQVIQNTLGPVEPAGVKAMTAEEAAAASLFRHNLDALDASGRMRAAGEFGQAYGRDGEKVVATTPLLYARGGAVSLPHPLPAGTRYVIHSHNRPPAQADNGFPSGEDYRTAYLASGGNTNSVRGEILFIPHENRLLFYQGRLNPETRAPEFHELSNPWRMPAPPPPEHLETSRPLPRAPAAA